MSRLCGLPDRTILLLLLLLVLASCSRPISQSAEAAHPVPFRDGNEASGTDSAAEPPLSSQDNGIQRGKNLPFQYPQTLPAGTLLSVRLQGPVSSDNSGASVLFAAVVDQSVIVDGQTLIPRGAEVAGRVESTGFPTGNSRGYVRLTLDSVDIDGQDLPIRTSSVFARGDAVVSRVHDHAETVTLEQGRRLTFRLADPTYVVGQSTSPLN